MKELTNGLEVESEEQMRKGFYNMLKKNFERNNEEITVENLRKFFDSTWNVVPVITDMIERFSSVKIQDGDTLESVVDKIMKLSYEDQKPKKYTKEIGIPLEDVGKRLEKCIKTFEINGFQIGANYGSHLKFIEGEDKIVESATIEVFFLKEEKELGEKK